MNNYKLCWKEGDVAHTVFGSKESIDYVIDRLDQESENVLLFKADDDSALSLHQGQANYQFVNDFSFHGMRS